MEFEGNSDKFWFFPTFLLLIFPLGKGVRDSVTQGYHYESQSSDGIWTYRSMEENRVCRHGPLLCTTLLREQQALPSCGKLCTVGRSLAHLQAQKFQKNHFYAALLKSPSPAQNSRNKTALRLLSQPYSRGRDQQPHVQAQPCPGIRPSLPAPAHTKLVLG